MVQQLAHGDLVAVGQQPGQVPAHRGVQADLPARDQLEHQGGHERLGLAGHPEGLDRAGRLAGAQVAHPGDPPDGAAVVLDAADGAGRPGGHHGVQQPLEVGRAGDRRGRGRLGRAGQGQAEQQGERDQEAEAPAHAAVPFGRRSGRAEAAIPVHIAQITRPDQPAGSRYRSGMRPPSERLELPDAWGTSRASRLFPGWWLAHADLHNHTQLSDGAGDPRLAFPSMRAAGLDVAALTDHSRWASLFLDLAKAPGWTGIDGRAWRQTNALAEAANADGEFVALHGFEWSHAAYGHMNVWNSERFTDPLRTVPTMGRFWRWLETPATTAWPGSTTPAPAGSASAASATGRPWPGAWSAWSCSTSSTTTCSRTPTGACESPLNQCLNAGWRVGLLGVTDEHGPDWGHPEGKGRAGLWLRELTRAGRAGGAGRPAVLRQPGQGPAPGRRPDLAGRRGGGCGGAGPHGHRRGPSRRPGADRGRPGPGPGLGGPAARPPGAAARGAAARPGRRPRGRPARPRRSRWSPSSSTSTRPTATGWCCGSPTRPSRPTPGPPATGPARAGRSPTPARSGCARLAAPGRG